MSAHKGFPLWLVAPALAVGLFLLLTGPVVAQAPVVDIQPSTATVAPNEQVSFVVTVTRTIETSPSVPLTVEVRWEPDTAVANTFPRESPAELEEDRISWVLETPETITTTVAFTLQVGSEPAELVVRAKAVSNDQQQLESEEQRVTVQIQPDQTQQTPELERANLAASRLDIQGREDPQDTDQPATVTVELNNAGPGVAQDVQFSLTQNPPTQLDLTPVEGPVQVVSPQPGPTIQFSVTQPVSQGVPVKIVLAGFVLQLPAEQTTGELRLEITADNADSVELVDTFQAPVRPNVVLNGLEIRPDSLVPNNQMHLTVNLENRSPQPLGDLAVLVHTEPEVEWVQQASSTFGDVVIEPREGGNAVARMLTEIPPEQVVQLFLQGTVPALEGSLRATAEIFELSNNQASPEETFKQVDQPIEPALPPTQPASAEPTPVSTTPVTTTTTLTPTTSEQAPGEGTSDDGGLPAWLVPLIFVSAALLLVALVGVWYSRRQTSPAPASGPAPAQARPPLPAAPQPEVRPAAPVTPTYQPSTRLEAVTVPGLVYRLQKEVTTIGRAEDCDIKIDQRFLNWETVSRHHAEIRREGEQWVIRDMQSTNGVFVERRRTVKNLLRHGWRIGIGGVEFIFHEDVSRSPGGIEA